MNREIKVKILESVRQGLPLRIAMKADKYSVLFKKQDHYSTSIDDDGERVSIKEAELLQKHFPEKIFISHITGITFNPE